jgi:DNA (cytosine-5)-methyltransferase 1
MDNGSGEMKILELFSGYGTATFALKRLNIPHEIVGYSDIDKYANQCFQQNHGGKELGDVKLINPDTLRDFDLLTGGFPCQSFSVAGKGLGELDPRGTLFYEIIRIAEVKQPKYMLLENVKGLTNKTHKATFDKILSELDRIGYKVYWKVLNSKDYGIPQSRARVWFVCFRKDIDKGFEFPKAIELRVFIKDIIEQQVDEHYYLSDKAKGRLLKRNGLPKKGIAQTLTANMYKINWMTPLIEQHRPSYVQFDFGNHSQQDRIYNPEGISPTLNTRDIKVFSLYPRSGNPKQGGTGGLSKSDGTSYCVDTGNMQALMFIDNYNKKVQEICPTLSDPCHNTLRLFDGVDIRRLTPKECFRLMGFLNDEINLEGLSDTQRYKLAGNGQDVNMVSLIFKEMFK